ncbi:MAG: MMPL family transporter [Gammaproteobacteria bacterium]
MRFEPLANGIARLVAWVTSRPWAVIAVFALMTAGSGYYAANNLGINTDTADMIARDLPWRQDFIAFREQFPNRFRTVIIVVDGTQAAVDLTAANWVGAMQQRPDLFLDVYQPLGGEFLQRYGLLYLPLEELEQLADRLTRAQPLIGSLTEDSSGAHLLETLADFVTRDAGAVRELNPLMQQLAQVVDDHAQGQASRLDWGGLAGAQAGSPRQILVVQPALDFSKPRPARAAMEFLRALQTDTTQARVRLTGSVAMEHEELDSVVRGASLAGLLALLLVTGVLYIALRSVLLLCVSMLTLMVGLTLTGAFAAMAVGHLNLISVAFAVLYIGLGIDFIIHSILRFQELRGEGLSADHALPAAARGVGMSLVICAVTTAAGFYAFIPTPFEGVSELGLISGTGMFLSLAVSLTLLPALLRVVAPRLDAVPGRSSQAALGWRPSRGWVIAVTGVVTVAGLIALGGVRFDNDPLNLREAQTESVEAFTALLEDERIAPRTLTVLAESETAAENLVTALQALPEVKRVLTVATLVPDAQPDKLFVLEDLQLLLGPQLGQLQTTRADTARFASALPNLVDALALQQAGAPHSLAGALTAFREHVDSLGQVQRNAQLAALDHDLMVEFGPGLERLKRALSATTVSRDTLPDNLVKRFVLPDGRALVEVHPAGDLTDNLAASAFIDAVWQVAPRATGRPVVNREGGATVVRSFQMAFTYALATVACLVWLFLGRWSDSLRVLAPVLIVSVVTAATAVAFDQAFNFANIIALPLLLGVGVDNGIHMVHRWRSEPPTAATLRQVSTGRAVLFSGLTTVASFGNLGFSPHPGMASMGWILTVGMVATLLATLVLLPALLPGRRQ